jgi:mitochondrial fission protein ELM1
MPAITVLILSDGRPGHYNLSEGIAAAIGRLRPPEIKRIDVRRGRWPGRVTAMLTNARLPARSMLRGVYGLDPSNLPKADIVVSAGAETLAANVWAARILGIPNVFYGSLRLFRPTDFSLVLTSYARNAGLPRHALALKPSRTDPDRLPPAASPVPLGPSAPPKAAALLIGGDAGGITYAKTDWTRLLDFLTSSHTALGTRWLVSNSRRTPTETSDRIARLAEQPRSPIDRFIDVRTANAPPLESLFAAANAVVCTADSSSMVSEAIWNRRPLVTVRPATFRLPPDEAEYRAWLTSQHWQASISLDQISPIAFTQALAGIEPLKTNPQAALADLLAERIPELAAGGHA